MERIKKIIGVLLLIGAVACLVVALLQLKEYEDGDKEYRDIISGYVKEPEGNTDGDDFFLDWDGLYAQNPDLVGWIRMDPEVSYPIVQGEDNSFYLHRGFDKSYNVNGCIMMNCYNSPDWSDRNTIVYGHNMRSGSMFGNNDFYAEKSYSEEHPFFYIYTKEGRYAYRIFSTMTVPDDSRPFETGLASDEAFQEYLDDINRMKDYDLGVEVTTQDQIVTLSTCNSTSTKRFLIQGKLESFKDWDGNEITVEELRSYSAVQTGDAESMAQQEN